MRLVGAICPMQHLSDHKNIQLSLTDIFTHTFPYIVLTHDRVRAHTHELANGMHFVQKQSSYSSI